TQPAELPNPLRSVSPIRVTEVLDTQALVKAPADDREAEHLHKIIPDLWKVLLDKEKATAVLRAQIILTTTPAPGDASWRAPLLRAVPDLSIEGRLGPMVTALVRVDQIKALAGVPSVSTVRIPRPARVDVDPALPIKGDSDRALKQSGLEA